MAVHDDQTGKDFGRELLKPICGNCGTRHLLPCTKGGPVQSGGSNSTQINIFDGVHTRGGGGGTGKCEVIPYCEAGFNTTTQAVRTPISPYEPRVTAAKPAPWYPGAPVIISSGCFKCDEILCNTKYIAPNTAYLGWYNHYIEADRRGDYDFAIRHLDFIMAHMMKCVTPDTELPALPSAKIHVPAAEKKKSTMSRTDKWCDLVALPLIHAALLIMLILAVVAIIFLIAGVQEISYSDFTLLMAGSTVSSLGYSYIRAINRYINSRK